MYIAVLNCIVSWYSDIVGTLKVMCVFRIASFLRLLFLLFVLATLVLCYHQNIGSQSWWYYIFAHVGVQCARDCRLPVLPHAAFASVTNIWLFRNRSALLTAFLGIKSST